MKRLLVKNIHTHNPAGVGCSQRVHGDSFAMLQQMGLANKEQECVTQYHADDTHCQAHLEHVVLLNQSC